MSSPSSSVSPSGSCSWSLPPLWLIQGERARRRLAEYVRQAWHVVEPTTPYIHGWHIDAIAEHLEAVTAGQIRNLVINVPPRHAKSLIISVFWPTWEWASAPERRWLFSSYAASLSTRDSLKCRRLIESQWYQRNWGHLYALTSDQNVKTRFENDRTGYRIATSVGGSATGEGGDRIVVDDPHNVQEAESDTVRAGVLRWWDEVMSTRLNDPRVGAKVIVMQRVHEQDLTGHVLDQGGYEHLCLPCEYESRPFVSATGWRDPRGEPGELLWPERFGHPEVEELKRRLGSYAVAGQLQQRPAPAGGGMFKREWFKIVEAPPAEALARVRFWDFGATEDGGDPSVGTRVSMDRDGIIYVEAVSRGQWSPDQTEKIVVQDAALDGTQVRIRLEQEPGSSGKTVVAHWIKKLVGYDVQGVPATGEKPTRWRPFAAQAEAGNVRLVKGDWNEAWLNEMAIVPYGAHDDQADSVAGAFNDLALNVRGYGDYGLTI